MRGKRGHCVCLIPAARITPADAGKTDEIGEPVCMCDRITPADAGKTCSRISGWRGSWDHPRGCGEN